MKPDILVVGAGPIGLLSAIEAKLHNPKANIVLFERNKEYTRHHTLLVDPTAFKGSHPDERLQAILSDFHGPVPTSTIEAKLKQFADELGIKIEYEKIEDPQVLLDRYPSAHTLIGADGAHSTVRKKFFNDEKSVDKNLQYIVEVKYHVRGKTTPTPLTTYAPALSQTEHFVSEQIGRKKNGKTPVSLFFFVDKETYQEVYARKKLKLTDLVKPETRNMTQLANSIRPWLALRRAQLKDQLVADSETIAGVELSTYCTATFAKTLPGNRRVILLGDAGSGVPFNRAFNAGVERTILAAKQVAFPPGQDEAERLKAINTELHEQVRKEIARAKRTNHKVQFGRFIGEVKRGPSYSVAAPLLDEQLLEAMQDARVEQLSFTSRHPRAMTTFAAWLVLTVVALVVFPFLFASIYTAIAAAILLPLAVIAIGVALYKGIAYCLKPNEMDEAQPEPVPFPWEETLSDEQAELLQEERLQDKAKSELMQEPAYLDIKKKIHDEKEALSRLRDHREHVAIKERPHGPLVATSLPLLFPDAHVHFPSTIMEEQPPSSEQLQVHAKRLERIDDEIEKHQRALASYKLKKFGLLKEKLNPSNNKQEESLGMELKS
ncbi:FAD-dependent oxidoreductase [Legionella erythra]|uniref:Salicylyl-CoA 5-hydroxylase n=1 Tax=Legionella erythra TaxID=448 RepID=A0A0W0TQ48_LEGER|nr:hypothetical protein [Legionella erythra]KTC97648.1 salicylyl-CoA 5-hydroxylase [Legionella erythra]